MSQYETGGPYYGGGGGYIAGGSPYSANGSPGMSRKTEGSSTLRPMVIKQLRLASQAHADAEYLLDDVEIGQITIVAQVITVQEQTTNMQYTLEDGTGRIEARHWVDSSNAEAENLHETIPLSYARVTGTLKTFGNKRYINATHIRPVKDAYEPYFHLAEAMQVTRIFEKGPPPRPGEEQKPYIQGAPMDGVTSTSAYMSQSHGPAALDEYAHLPPLQRQILQAMLAAPPNEEGVHVAAIARAVGGDAMQISSALDKLMDDGHVFSTIDDSHFNVSR